MTTTLDAIKYLRDCAKERLYQIDDRVRTAGMTPALQEALAHAKDELQQADVALAELRAAALPPPPALTPAQLQTEHRLWAAALFGAVPAYRPLLGLIEELGELLEAIDAWDVPKIKDALADATIFIAGYCTQRGWDFAGIFPAEPRYSVLPSKDVKESAVWAMRNAAEVAHRQLKTEDKIRGSAEDHAAKGCHAVCRVLCQLSAIALHFGLPLMEIVALEWQMVKQRTLKDIK